MHTTSSAKNTAEWLPLSSRPNHFVSSIVLHDSLSREMSFACRHIARPNVLKPLCRLALSRTYARKPKPNKHALSTMDQPPEDYTSWSNSSLIDRITHLEAQLRAQNLRHAGVSSATSPPAVKKKPKKPSKPFDPSKYSTRFIALKFAYLGTNYNGFEHHSNNPTPLPTIEEELWKALRKTKLIFPKWREGQSEDEVCWEGVEYSKCGRTDRGVSAFGQVVGVRFRSARPKSRQDCVERNSGVNNGTDDGVGLAVDAGGDSPMPDLSTASAADGEHSSREPAWDPIKDELPYIQLLNRVLPPDIKILAWCPDLPPDFSARFSCKERRYRYFFTNPAFVPLPGVSEYTPGSAWLDIPAMQQAARKLEGLHDFRNLCKIDPSKQITNFERRVFSADIHGVSDDQEPGAFLSRPPFPSQADKNVASTTRPQLFYFEVCGSAFLWHQVRHMVAILFLVGQGYEDPSVVDELLDTENTPSKPMYEMADDTPLVLWECVFPDRDKVGQNDHNNATYESGYEDSLDWVFVGDDHGGRDTAKRPDASVGTGKYGRNGIMDDLWAQWRKCKMDEVLAGSVMDLVARQPMRSSRYENGASQPVDAESARVFDGSEAPRAVGTYVPIMRRERMETPEVVNARYAARKGLNGERVVNGAAEDMDE